MLTPLYVTYGGQRSSSGHDENVGESFLSSSIIAGTGQEGAMAFTPGALKGPV